MSLNKICCVHKKLILHSYSNIVLHVSRDNTLDIAGPYREVTLPIMEAMQAYEDQEFDKAVEIMKPLKYHIHRSGGSHAQVLKLKQ